MDNNYTQIEKYLQQEMSEAERLAFENRLATDKDFQQEFTVQEQLTRVAINAGIKNEFGEAIRKKILNQQLIGLSVIVAIVASVFLFFAIKNNWVTNHKKEAVNGIEKFEIKNDADTIIETKNGVVFAIPGRAFGSTGNAIQLEIKTALTPNEIMQNGLSTMSDGSLLQTAGMFYINGFEDGKQIPLMKEVAVSVPANNINPAMQLFDGVEDKEGNINWVNPKTIQNNLRTFEITSLDFYPPHYIPTLKAVGKKYQDKKYTDSLYYSFSGYERQFPSPKKDTVLKPTTIVNEAWPNYSAIKFQQDTTIEIIRRYGYTDTTSYTNFEIDPAKIRAIWNPKFNNSILATKEFEERLHYMQGLCTSKYLNTYLENLDKSLYEIDKMIADKSSGEIKKKFLEFAARKDGGVIIAAGMQQKLNTYLQEKYKAYQQAATITRAKYDKELVELNKIADAKTREQAINEFNRNEKNFDEEFCINLSDAYSQIGVNRSSNDTIIPPTSKYYNVIITTTGWKNLDMYVFDATTNRESMTYTDPVSGKVATLTYKEVNIQIEDQSAYDKVLVYLIPDSLSSFQKISQQETRYNEKLNSLFRYDVVALAYKGTQAYYYRQQNVQPQNYMFSLSTITDNALRMSLNTYSFSKTKSLNSEFEYQLFEQQEVMRQIQLQKDLDFREQVSAAIFKCNQDRPLTKPATTEGSSSIDKAK